MNNEQRTLNYVRRPLKREDWILLWGTMSVMVFMVWYTGVFWYILLGVPMLASLVWVCHPRNIWLKITHGFLLGFFWFVSMIGLGQWVKYYLIEIYKVPTNSMEQTIIPGDRVLVCKWVYGARQFNGEGSERLLGYGEITRGDVVVFNSPENTGKYEIEPRITEVESGGDWEAQYARNVRQRTPYVKRCVALPGDVVEVRESELFVNGKLQPAPATAVFRYRAYFGDSLSMQRVSAMLKEPPKMFPSRAMFEAYLTKAQADTLTLLPDCTQISLSYSRKGNAVVFPHDDSLLWNLNRWGPMWIPRRGDSIALTEENIYMYGPLIALHEGHRLAVSGDSAWIDGQPRHFYVFVKDYYFMLGDHRMESQDSRILGPIPEDHIIGKATHIMWSLPVEKPRKFRWKRIFKRLANN